MSMVLVMAAHRPVILRTLESSKLGSRTESILPVYARQAGAVIPYHTALLIQLHLGAFVVRRESN